jgi:hypothetical protein
MIVDGCHRHANGGPLTLIWPSETFVVAITSDNPEVDTLLLKRYLAVYPSSL